MMKTCKAEYFNIYMKRQPTLKKTNLSDHQGNLSK